MWCEPAMIPIPTKPWKTSRDRVPTNRHATAAAAAAPTRQTERKTSSSVHIVSVFKVLCGATVTVSALDDHSSLRNLCSSECFQHAELLVRDSSAHVDILTSMDDEDKHWRPFCKYFNRITSTDDCLYCNRQRIKNPR